MVKVKEIKRKRNLANGLPLLILLLLFGLFVAAILRIGVGEAEWSGLVVSNLDTELRSRYGISQGRQGVCIVEVQEEAFNSGVKLGDLLVSINGQATKDVSSFLRVARDIQISDGVLLDLVRNKEPLYLTLYDRPGFHGKIKKYLGMDPRNTTQVALTANAGFTPLATATDWLGMDFDQGINGILVDDIPGISLGRRSGFMVDDLIVAIDGIKVPDSLTFNKVTLNGTTTSGIVEILRRNRPMHIIVQDQISQGLAQKVAFTANTIQPQQDPVLTTPGPAASLPPVEGHWVGMETLDLSPQLALFLHIPSTVEGVLVDEAVMEAQDAGIMAGDVIAQIGNMNTYNLQQFRAATRVIANQKTVNVIAYRKGKYLTFTIKSVLPVGTAQMETAQMIRRGAVAPHRYRGACTNCHTIGNTGQLPKDAGDLLLLNAPPIKKGAKAPHRYRGRCMSCHTIIK